jgi:hypothetical protein
VGRPETFFQRAVRVDGKSVAGKGDPRRDVFGGLPRFAWGPATLRVFFPSRRGGPKKSSPVAPKLLLRRLQSTFSLKRLLRIPQLGVGRPETFFQRAVRSDGKSVAGKGDPRRDLSLKRCRSASPASFQQFKHVRGASPALFEQFKQVRGVSPASFEQFKAVRGGSPALFEQFKAVRGLAPASFEKFKAVRGLPRVVSKVGNGPGSIPRVVSKVGNGSGSGPGSV